MQTDQPLTPWDPEVKFALVRSVTPVDEDGYKIGEFKYLVCDECQESVLLTEDPSAGVDELPHRPWCPQRFAKSEWWRGQFRNV